MPSVSCRLFSRLSRRPKLSKFNLSLYYFIHKDENILEDYFDHFAFSLLPVIYRYHSLVCTLIVILKQHWLIK